MGSNVVAKIICLVRADDDATAQARVEAALKRRDLDVDEGTLEVYAADLSSERIGLDSGVYSSLTKSIHIVIHVSWPTELSFSLLTIGGMASPLCKQSRLFRR